MSSRYLEHFLDSVETLPYDLQRNFTLMRELDGYSQETIQSIARRTEDFFKSITELSNPERQSQLKTLRDDFEKCLEYGDDKVELAMQTYEMVDKHIRRLDSDLHKFEAELAQASDGGLIPDDQLPDGGAQKRKALRELESSRHSKQARNGANGGANGGGFGSPGAPGNGSTGGGAGGSSSAAGGGAQQRGLDLPGVLTNHL